MPLRRYVLVGTIYLFYFTHSLLPHPQLLLCPYLRKAGTQYGACKSRRHIKRAQPLLHVMRACRSLRADRAVTIFAIIYLPAVASFQALVPHAFHSATSATRARVAHSLHYTAQHFFILQYSGLIIIFEHQF